MQTIVDAWDDIKDELGGTARVIDRNGRQTIIDSRYFEDLLTADGKAEAFRWLSERVNSFVNVMRPRVRSASQDFS